MCSTNYLQALVLMLEASDNAIICSCCCSLQACLKLGQAALL
jgi:hypothetical protein